MVGRQGDVRTMMLPNKNFNGSKDNLLLCSSAPELTDFYFFKYIMAVAKLLYILRNGSACKQDL